MNAVPFPDPDGRYDEPAPQSLICKPPCSDAELYDLLFHYHRLGAMLARYRVDDVSTQAALRRVLTSLEEEAQRRGIPLHRLPA